MIEFDIGPLMSWVGGLDTTTYHVLRVELSYFVPNYERMKDYIYGNWDGKRYLLQAHGGGGYIFPTGLLTKVLQILDTRRWPYHIRRDMDRPQPNTRLNYLLQSGFPLHPYQRDAIAAGLTKRIGRMGGVIKACTGSGKTRMAAGLIKTFRVPTVYYVNTKDLLHQAIDELKALLNCPIGQVGDGVCDVQDITVATVQTTCRAFGIVTSEKTNEKRVEDLERFKLWLSTTTQMVVMDECHIVAADTVYECVYLPRQAQVVFGLSASPWRDDGQDILIEAACGSVIYSLPASDLIDMINPLTGRPYLVPPHITVYDLPEPAALTPAHADTSRPHEFHKAWIIDHHERNLFIKKLAEQDMVDGRVVLILVKRYEHGEILEKLIPGSRFIDGRKGTKKRKSAYDEIRAGTLRCLIATTLADQGLDLPIASSLILAAGGRSSTKALQRIGRIIRDHITKKDARVHDLVDAHKNFKAHYNSRNRIYKTERRFTVRRVAVLRHELAA